MIPSSVCLSVALENSARRILTEARHFAATTPLDTVLSDGDDDDDDDGTDHDKSND